MTKKPSASRIAVSLEVGSKLTFASALDWPGWCRSGRDASAAVAALRAYAPRHAPVVRDAGLTPPDPDAIEVVEHLPGSGTTDFGAPGAISPVERERCTPAEAARLASLLDACWRHLDRVAAGAPAALRKGPRGGGRDRDAIVDHVLSAERDAYARKIGLRLPAPDRGDPSSIATQRAAIKAVILSAAGPRSASPPPPAPDSVLPRRSASAERPERGWPVRYAVRRIAWHVLDHAWEIEDRSAPAPPA